MAKIAIPVNDKLLSNQFNNCGYYDIYEIIDKQIVSKSRENYCLETVNDLNRWIQNNGITDFIVHGIDKSSVAYFADTKINLFIGVHINSSDKLVDEYLKGTLQSNTKIIQ